MNTYARMKKMGVFTPIHTYNSLLFLIMTKRTHIDAHRRLHAPTHARARSNLISDSKG